MKATYSLILISVFCSCASAKNTDYTGSTPAGPDVRSFLGISMTDSIDFIRWKLTINDREYKLNCNFGISKPNTNGFYDGGKIVEFSGGVKREKNIFLLLNGNKKIAIAEFNTDLLHFLDIDLHPLKGNGGWSYTLNNLKPSVSYEMTMISKKVILKDSMAFEGRTPCGVPGVIEQGKDCYKLKWYVVLYADPARNQPTTFRILGTAWRKDGGKPGKWSIVTGKDGRLTYRLYDDKGKTIANLVKADENLLLFSDANNNLLVGDLDFSYTLNRRF